MALGAISAEVAVTRRAREIVLATPSPASYHRAVCGYALPAEESVLVGNATKASGEPVAGLHVAAAWNEAVLRTSGSAMLLRGSVDTTDANGFFALCGVPADAQYHIRGGDDDAGTAVLTVSASPHRVRRQDLRVGAAVSRVRVRGRLADESGASLAGSVEVNGDSGAAVQWLENGTFEVTVSERSTQLWVRAIGHTPRYIALEPAGSDLDIGDVRLERVPQEIEGRLIAGRLVSREEFAFEERRKAGLGVFFDSAFLARLPRVSANALAGSSPRIRAGRAGGPGEVVLLRRGVDQCFPRVFVDGVYFGVQGVNRGAGRAPVVAAEMMAAFLQEAKRIEVYSATRAPAEFQDFDGCGVIVIWTK